MTIATDATRDWQDVNSTLRSIRRGPVVIVLVLTEVFTSLQIRPTMMGMHYIIGLRHGHSNARSRLAV